MFSLTSKAPSDNPKTAQSPVRTILVFSAVVAPLAIVPYVLVRSRLAGLRTQLAELQATNTELAKELRRVKWDVDNGLDDVRRHVGTTVEREGKRLEKMLVQAERGAQERDGMRRAWEDEMRRSVGTLLNENRARRTRFAAGLKELGHSLADTAAFVQEVEVRQGWTPRPDDGRGIERTRRLARTLLEDADILEKQHASPSRLGSNSDKGNQETRSQ